MAGRTVLVTGATAGIGKATALGLATMGAHLGIIGRDARRTEDAAREIRAAGGGQVDVFVADLPTRQRYNGWPSRYSRPFRGSMRPRSSSRPRPLG
jgi:short-subunit dehydrogenase